MILFKAIVTLENIFLMILGVMTTGFLISSIGMNEMAASLPRAVSLIALPLILYTLICRVITGIRLGEAPPPPEEDEEALPFVPEAVEEPAQSSSEEHSIHWWVMFLICLSYPVLMSLAGFMVSTVVYCGVVGLLLHIKWWKVLLFAFLCSIGMFYFFQDVLQVFLPEGVIWKAWMG